MEVYFTVYVCESVDGRHLAVIARRRFFCVLLLAAVIFSGCSDDGPEKAVITGNITYRGEPIVAGEIRFIPDKNTLSPPWGATVVDGRYSAFGRGGVPVGTHKVQIYGWHEKKGADRPAPQMPLGGSEIQSKEQYVPPRYNTQTELTITVEPGSGEIVRDFALTN